MVSVRPLRPIKLIKITKNYKITIHRSSFQSHRTNLFLRINLLLSYIIHKFYFIIFHVFRCCIQDSVISIFLTKYFKFFRFSIYITDIQGCFKESFALILSSGLAFNNFFNKSIAKSLTSLNSGPSNLISQDLFALKISL